MAIRRNLFEQLGGFDEDFLIAGGEDMDFARRIRQACLRVKFVPEALVLHPARRIGWRELWRRTFQAHWGLLYQLKANREYPLLKSFGMDLLRSVYQLVSRHEAAEWRRRWFQLIWRCATAPLVASYLIYWRRRFLMDL